MEREKRELYVQLIDLKFRALVDACGDNPKLATAINDYLQVCTDALRDEITEAADGRYRRLGSFTGGFM